MKMPETLEEHMFAPCGMNCAVCYKHVGIAKRGTPCQGCLKSDEGKPNHCRTCAIKQCAQDRGHTHCFACEEFPCKRIRNLEKSYNKRYGVSLIANSEMVRKKGTAEFLELDRERWTCVRCGGAFSLHDGMCSECAGTVRKGSMPSAEK